MAMDVGAAEGKKGKASPEMNVTPLVDVVLVLLIIFMVIAPALKATFWVRVPERANPNEPAPPPDPNLQQPIVVSVRADGRIRINREIVPDAQFPNRLHRVLAARGERKVFFDAADGASYGRAVEVLDLARRGGAAHIAVLMEQAD